MVVIMATTPLVTPVRSTPNIRHQRAAMSTVNPLISWRHPLPWTTGWQRISEKQLFSIFSELHVYPLRWPPPSSWPSLLLPSRLYAIHTPHLPQ